MSNLDKEGLKQLVVQAETALERGELQIAEELGRRVLSDDLEHQEALLVVARSCEAQERPHSAALAYKQLGRVSGSQSILEKAVELFLRVERLDGVSECRELIKEIVSGREAEDDDLAAARAGRTTVVDGSNTVAEIAEPGVGVGVTNDCLEDKDTVQPVPQLDRRRPIWSIVLALFCIAVALLLRTLL